MKSLLPIVLAALTSRTTLAQNIAVLSNITISFGPESGPCPSPQSNPTFTTNIVPGTWRAICYNLQDIFASNNTRNATGFWNRTGNVDASKTIPYYLSQSPTFSPTANYSRIFYQQTNDSLNTREGDSGEGNKGAFSFITYPGLDCRNDVNPGERKLQPWYAWTCQTEVEGECEVMPYAVKSFSIYRATWFNEEGECFDRALGGDAAATVSRVPVWAITAVAIGTVVSFGWK